MRWQAYDPLWLVRLATAQHPDEPWLAEALSACTACRREGDKYVRFVDATGANRPGAAWQYEASVWLVDPDKGNLLLDVLSGRRIGGVEFYDRLFTAGGPAGAADRGRG